MKIAYVTYTRKDVSGIVAKVERQATAARAAGVDNLDTFVLHPSKAASPGNVRFVQIRPRPLRASWDHATGRFATVERSLDLSRYDYVVLRYPTADPSGLGFVRRHRVISEHHTDEIAELAIMSRTPMPPVKRAFAAWSWLCERTLGHHILERCHGMIAVTDEIARVERARLARPIPQVTISNGIDVGSITRTGFKAFDGKTLDLALLASSSIPWHGFDRVARSLAAYRGPVEPRLHVIGNVYPTEREALTRLYAGCVFHGERRGAELDALMAEMNLAVSTMALFRKKMEEACSLKTREYVARGIPFILAYRDPDLSSATAARFCRVFANDDSLFDLEPVIALAEEATRRRAELPELMRAYALDHLDWRAKMPRYQKFVEQVAARAP
jgi:hypothetical protein